MRRALVLLLILVLSLSFVYAALESTHECHGEAECPVCRVIAVLSGLFAVTAVSFVAVVFTALALEVSKRVRRGENVPCTSLIDLCVKLSN